MLDQYIATYRNSNTKPMSFNEAVENAKNLIKYQTGQYTSSYEGLDVVICKVVSKATLEQPKVILEAV